MVRSSSAGSALIGTAFAAALATLLPGDCTHALLPVCYAGVIAPPAPMRLLDEEGTLNLQIAFGTGQ